MADVAAIRDGIRAALAAITGLTAYDTWPDAPMTPCALVKPVRTESASMTLATQIHHFEITVLVQMGAMASAQDQLDGFYSDTGTSSVKAALLADDDFGGTAAGILDLSMRDYGVLELDTGGEEPLQMLGFVVDLEVLT